MSLSNFPQFKKHWILIQTQILRGIFTLLLGQERLKLFHDLDWQREIHRFQSPNFNYPFYYKKPDFHGIKNGYLNPIAPVTYDLVTAWATPPHERKIRQQLIQQIEGQPQQILDLGCGTGSMTLMLKQAFPQAQITGLDLSPYMLIMAESKAKKLGLDLQWIHSLAEKTPFPNQSYDVITISMLFHETPVKITQLILKEAFRLLREKGQIIILDGHQAKLRHQKWLIRLFREPYSQVYAQGNINDWLEKAGFSDISNHNIGWISQLTKAGRLFSHVLYLDN